MPWTRAALFPLRGATCQNHYVLESRGRFGWSSQHNGFRASVSRGFWKGSAQAGFKHLPSGPYSRSGLQAPGTSVSVKVSALGSSSTPSTSRNPHEPCHRLRSALGCD